ncbi:MAG TPA: ABC transporter substrate-binding protein [Candidatus Dormibacteraeota bacterium]|nr:ABC transporter substrate-binding protein [Candidatus Dormibacteraeota bacterium]
MMMRAGRRVVMALLGLVALTAGACGSTSTSAGGHTPIKVGFLLPLTGVVAANGLSEEDGFKLGLRDFGSNVDGHPIQVTYADTQNDPNIALTQARRLVESQGVDIVEGPLAANEIAAVSPYLGARGVPTDDLSMCSAQQLDNYPKFGNAFSSGWACNQPAIMGATWAASVKHWKHITIVALDFSFGWLVAGGFAAAFRKEGGVIDRFIWNPITATDFSPYVTQIPSNTEAVYAIESGQTAVRFTQAYAQFGLRGKIPLFGITQLTDYSVLPSESASDVLGLWTSAQYCDGIDTPQNQKFAQEYHQQYGTWPGYYSDAGYTKARLLIAALKKLGGNVSNKKAVAATMRTTPIVSSRGPVRLSGSPAYSPIQNIYICQVEQVGGDLRNVPIKTYLNVPPWGTLSEQQWLAEFRHDSAARPV